MNKRVAALLLAFSLLLLSGCSAMLERSYVSSAAHVDYSTTEDSSILRAETYQGLVNSILYFVNEHSYSGTIRLYNYTGDVESDLSNACQEVLSRDPLGAYAVRAIDYDSTRILTYYEVELRMSYSRSAASVEAIQSVTGTSGLRQELARMITALRSSTTVRVSYFSGDVESIESLFWLTYYSTPLSVYATPRVSVSLYPKSGSQRIVEISVIWPATPTTMEQRGRRMEESIAQLMEAQPPAQDAYTFEELVALLRSVTAYDPQGSSDILETLSGVPAGDLGLLLTMELLCQQTGLEVTMVSGTDGASEPCFWLIIGTDTGYRHLLPQTLRPDDDPDAPPPALFTDEELTRLGYLWPSQLYPACVDSSVFPVS